MSSALNNGQPATGDGITKRKSGSAACVHCHRRKVRCDARVVGLPCSNCRSSGKTDCRIHEKKKRLAVRSVLDPVPIRCRPAHTAPDSASKSLSPKPTTELPPLSNAISPSQHMSSNPLPAASNISHHRSQSFSGPHTSRRPFGSEASSERDENTALEKRLVNLIDEEDSGRRAIQRGVRAIYVGHELSNMSFLIRQQRDKDDDVYHFAGNEIPRQQLKTGHDQLLIDALTLPEKALADELVEAYFAYVNPGYPIVDEDSFMVQYHGREPVDPPSILLLQAIFLVGAHIARPKPERETLKEIFYGRAKWLFDNRIERSRDVLVQAALLLTWYSDTPDDDVSANAHYWVGVAARIGTGIGMHRNPVSGKFATEDRHMWRRLWYILLQFDVMISLSYGRPHAINLDDADVSPLTPADFQACGSRAQVEYVTHFSELCTMIFYIVRERFGLRVSAERRKAVLREADEALANWSLKLPDNLRLRASDMDPWSAMLHLTYNNFLILLHRPHPRASAYSDDYGPHDAEICSAAAGVIGSIFEELRLNDRLKYLWHSGVHTLFTAMIQVRVELRFSNPVLAINALRRFDSASYTLRELSEYWSHAGTILRLFEDSKRLQEDLRMATRDRPPGFGNNTQIDETKEPEASSSATSMPQTSKTATTNQQIPYEEPEAEPEQPQLQQQQQQPEPTLDPQQQNQQFDNWLPSNNLSSMEPMDQPREFLDWRQLFSFTDPDQPLPMPMEGLPELEDEWRQIYWQETPITDLLQDGGWMHG